MNRSDRETRKLIRKMILLVSLLGLLFLAAYIIGSSLENRLENQTEVRGDLSAHGGNARVVTYEDTDYLYRDDLLTILFMGMDTSDESNGAVGTYRNGGQSDFLMLLIIDPKTQTISQLHLDRDTMTEISVLGVLGNVAGTRTAQICLSSSFGDGKAQSCELTREAVERLLLGTRVDFYIAVHMNNIALLNDAVGGVPITLDEDFSVLDSAMTLGKTINLTGTQAELYVRSRRNVGDGSNASRIRRQQTYLNATIETITQRVSENSGYVATIFDQIADILLTDMKRGRIINEANKAMRYKNIETIQLPGEHRIGDSGFMEFYIDENAVESFVLNTFFAPIGNTPGNR